MLLSRASFYVVLFAFFACCLLVVLVRLSVPVQVIDWERLVSEMTYNVLTGTLNPTHSLTHSLTRIDH